MTAANHDPDDIIDRIADILERHGADSYAGESLTVAGHMLQTAALAQAEGAPEALVAAALLHDIGHFTGEFGEYTPADTVDKKHDEWGAKLLEAFFPPTVTECVRLHVAAKRYLCATDESYFDMLSTASKHSLQLQGGPMSRTEIAAFRKLMFHQDAVRLRRWDDAGKHVDMRTDTFESFKPLLLRQRI